MTMLTVDLDDTEHRGLKLLALRRGTSMSHIVRSLVAAELRTLSEPDRATVAEWSPNTVREVLGVHEDPDQATRDRVDAAIEEADRKAAAYYGRSATGAA
jgi:hypothetical protein